MKHIAIFALRIFKFALFVATFLAFPWIAGILALAIVIRKIVKKINQQRRYEEFKNRIVVTVGFAK